MSLAHIATLYAVIIIYTVHNSYSSTWKIPYKSLKDTKQIKTFKMLQIY